MQIDFIEQLVDINALAYIASPRYLLVKRLLDIIISFLSIVILSPILLLLVIVIKIDSKGAAFFCQERCGYKGKVFIMYKFRTMVWNALSLQKDLEENNEVKGPLFKIKKDPRITRVGTFLRKTSIDELPQLFNVLKGDMSLVGPRPPILSEVERYDPWHNLKLSVKPGITGLWQIRKRNEVGFDEAVRLDLKYIRERSLLMDLKIIIKTIPLFWGDEKAF